ncbi:MAG: hypothetical protein A49_08360 [Methyloceanibacter sp.]|nr:MAG: hypothetical protein A49_08360 [Methyloceanibacter sp.]
MLSRKILFVASFMAVWVTITIPSHADGRANARTFLSWDTEAQNAFIQTSIGMAGVVATQTRKEMATCIDRWYFVSEEAKAERNEQIRTTIKKHSDFHPTGTIVAILEKACGPFK